MALSQGVSFGRWSPFATPGDNHNLHAFLIATIGLGLLVVGLLFHHVLKRLSEAELHPREESPKESGADEAKANSSV